MEQLINGGTSNVEHGDFFHLCSSKVLTVAQENGEVHVTVSLGCRLYSGLYN